MDLGLFTMPAHPPERSLYDGAQWDLQVLEWADEYGYAEAWIGEHFTNTWEPLPCPDLLIAQALMRTKQIRLGPGVHQLPHHHPVELACRLAYLDHLAQGRLMIGVGPAMLPTDLKLFNTDATTQVNREMMMESIEIMIHLWTGEPGTSYEGKFWTTNIPEPLMNGALAHHLRPFQKPHPPIAMGGVTPNSESLKIAGERGYIPMTLNLSTPYATTHWQAIQEGAARSGRKPTRREWRVVREAFVADTDAEARRWALDGHMGQMYREFLLPQFRNRKILHFLKQDPDVPDEDVTPEYLVDNVWLVGSVDTVAEKLTRMYNDLGGFGALIILCFDYKGNPEPWRRSLELLAKEVKPRVEKGLGLGESGG